MSENRIRFTTTNSLSSNQQTTIQIAKQKRKQNKMNQQQRKEYYPNISYNNKIRCETRWDNDANVYGDISNEWQISLGNGKRLGRKWRKCDGFTYVYDNNGCERAILNENYINLAPPKGLKRHDALRYADDDYDMSMQPDGEPGFYRCEIQRSYGNY